MDNLLFDVSALKWEEALINEKQSFSDREKVLNRALDEHQRTLNIALDEHQKMLNDIFDKEIAIVKDVLNMQTTIDEQLKTLNALDKYIRPTLNEIKDIDFINVIYELDC